MNQMFKEQFPDIIEIILIYTQLSEIPNTPSWSKKSTGKSSSWYSTRHYEGQKRLRKHLQKA